MADLSVRGPEGTTFHFGKIRVNREQRKDSLDVKFNYRTFTMPNANHGLRHDILPLNANENKASILISNTFDGLYLKNFTSVDSKGNVCISNDLLLKLKTLGVVLQSQFGVSYFEDYEYSIELNDPEVSITLTLNNGKIIKSRTCFSYTIYIEFENDDLEDSEKPLRFFLTWHVLKNFIEEILQSEH